MLNETVEILDFLKNELAIDFDTVKMSQVQFNSLFADENIVDLDYKFIIDDSIESITDLHLYKKKTFVYKLN